MDWAMRVCCLSCVVVLFEGFVSLQRVSVACFPPNNTLKRPSRMESVSMRWELARSIARPSHLVSCVF